MLIIGHKCHIIHNLGKCSPVIALRPVRIHDYNSHINRKYQSVCFCLLIKLFHELCESIFVLGIHVFKINIYPIKLIFLGITYKGVYKLCSCAGIAKKLVCHGRVKFIVHQSPYLVPVFVSPAAVALASPIFQIPIFICKGKPCRRHNIQSVYLLDFQHILGTTPDIMPGQVYFLPRSRIITEFRDTIIYYPAISHIP